MGASVGWWHRQSCSSMLAKVAVSMVALHLGQAYPTYSLQGYSSVPAVPELEPYGALKQAKESGSAKPYGALSFQHSPISHSSPSSSGNYIADTQEVARAKQEFMETFRAATNGLLGELAPGPIQDTAEVAAAKQEFFRIFESALNGMIETRFMRDTAEVQERKDQFFGTFDSAVTHLIDTVEVAYLEDTAEVQEAKARFGDAFADAEAGIVGRQYIEDTVEVQEAKARFFKFFQFAVDGLLYKLNPVPGNNVLPPEIVDFYIREQHSENTEEHDDQEDVKDIEEEKTKETNEAKEDFERPQVAIAPESSKLTPSVNDDNAFIKMGIQFVKAVRTSDWDLVDDFDLKLENYFQQNLLSRSQKAVLWSLLTSKL